MSIKNVSETNTERNATRERVHKILDDIETRLNADSSKASVADYVRLLQFERELNDDEGPKEITVTWIDPKEASSEEK